MLDTQGQWSEALADNNMRAIICWLRKLTAKGEMERFRSLIQGIVTQLDRQNGCIWTSEDCTDHCYPPPNLQALLKLVLVPHIDNMSIQALLMYFVLDLANFLQCKDDLFKSFCHACTIPSSFSQHIRAFWMFDHGHIKGARGTVNGTTGSQLPLMNKGRPPCPLSAKLYQAQRVNTVSPEELVQLLRKAVMEATSQDKRISSFLNDGEN
ncbi:hypothetical protein PFLUV_G00233760 [Perca fluviatilis]|uniref:ELYS-like domain-containing protein n=1 Tax=Perca fluviatilis TaxID=8168 RepID=A0A6A5DR09_PERFL|nr:hypothetical protein PFLUV_G00233760 [Perca fluviatilis]